MHEEMSADLLQEVAGQILEDAAFIFTEPNEEIEWGDSDTILSATVPYSCDIAGDIIVSASGAFARSLAANLLGLDPDDEGIEGQEGDALGEFVNIFGGALLARWFGAEQKYEMGIPKVESTAASEQNKRISDAKWWTALVGDDEFRIDIVISVK